MNEKILETWKSQMEAISSEWDGDESGVKEDRAHAAGDAISHIDSLSELFEELDF